MANAMFDPGREGFANAAINWETGNIKAMLVRSTYTFNAAHRNLNEIGAVDNGRSANLSGKTFTSGVLDAADTFVNAIALVASNAIVIYQDSGLDSTSRLIAYIDTPTTGLPCTPGVGQRVDFVWDNGANRIVKI